MKSYIVMVEIEVEAEGPDEARVYIRESLKDMDYFIDFLVEKSEEDTVDDDDTDDWVTYHLS